MDYAPAPRELIMKFALIQRSRILIYTLNYTIMGNQEYNDKVTPFNGGSIVPVTFGLLGPLLVKDGDGMAIRIPQTKHRIIIAACLLRANTTVSSDQLAEVLWGERRPPNAMAVLRTYVARLRKTLGQAGALLVSRPAGYAIVIHESAEFDLDQVERLRASSREAAEAGQWEHAALSSRKALNLWRGAPLEDIPSAALHRSVAGRLDELQLQLSTTRIDAELQLGRESDVIGELRQLADEHPLHEHIQAQLMLAYYRCGRQAEALDVYGTVRACLVDELGVEPGPELRRLHLRILGGDPSLEPARRSGSATDPRSGMELLLSRFIGDHAAPHSARECGGGRA